MASLNQCNYSSSIDSEDLIAFTAHLASPGQSASISGNALDAFPFDVTSLNLGDHFSPLIHSFVCPLSGVYEFHATITYYASSNPFQVTLVKNSEVLATLQDDPVLGGAIVFSRYKSIIVACVVDDVVFVRLDTAISDEYFLADKHTSFSGRLLTPDEGTFRTFRYL